MSGQQNKSCCSKDCARNFSIAVVMMISAIVAPVIISVVLALFVSHFATSVIPVIVVSSVVVAIITISVPVIPVSVVATIAISSVFMNYNYFRAVTLVVMFPFV